jgi:hypothetical protein
MPEPSNLNLPARYAGTVRDLRRLGFDVVPFHPADQAAAPQTPEEPPNLSFPSDEDLLTSEQAAEMVGVVKASWTRGVHTGKYPKSVEAWRRGDVTKYLETVEADSKE